MLKKLLKAALFGLFFCGLNASAEGVRIEIETDNGEVQISVETTEGWVKKLKPSPRVIYPEPKVNIPPAERYPEVGFHSIDRREYRDDAVKEWLGPPCEDDSDCVETCRELFPAPRRLRGKCTDLSTVSVIKIKEVVDIFKVADEEKLEEMNLDALKLLLSIGTYPVEKVLERMQVFRKKDFLSWLAENEFATGMIGKRDDDGYDNDKFRVLKALFGSDKASFIYSLNWSIDGRDSFVEKALEEWNEEALDWINEFFEHQCNPDENDYTKCVFEYYCALELNQESEDEYMSYHPFEDMLDDILWYHRPENAPDWWRERMDSGDLEEYVWQSQPHNVCSALGMAKPEAQTEGAEQQQTGETEPQQTGG